MILIYTICKSKQEAKKIAGVLLKLKLIACANWWPLNSTYCWKNKIVNAHETAMYLKTRKENFRQVAAVIKKIHSAETPCIVELDIDQVDRQYQAWVRKETRMI